MTDSHSHLRRLVKTTASSENAMNYDPMTYLQQLAGMRSTLPSLEEASEMRNFEVGGYDDPSAAHEKAMKIKMKGGKSIRIDEKSGKWVITYTATSKLHEDAEDIELPEAAVSGASPVIPDLSRWKTKIVGKGVVSRSIGLQGRVVNVIERGEPKGSGLYRYTLYIDGKKIGKQDFTDTKDMFRTIKTAVVEDTRFSILVKKSRSTLPVEMGEGQPYDPAEDPRRFTDKMLYDFMDMAAEVGGENRIKLSRAAYKRYSAALREMKNRKLPVKRPPASDFDSSGMYTKAVPGAKGGVRPKGESVTEATEDTEGRYSLVRHKGTVHAKGQNRDWWEVMYPTKSGKLAKIATITQTSDEDEPYEVEVGTLRPEVLMQSFRAVGDAFRAAIKRWEKSHAKGESVESVESLVEFTPEEMAVHKYGQKIKAEVVKITGDKYASVDTFFSGFKVNSKCPDKETAAKVERAFPESKGFGVTYDADRGMVWVAPTREHMKGVLAGAKGESVESVDADRKLHEQTKGTQRFRVMAGLAPLPPLLEVKHS